MSTKVSKFLLDITKAPNFVYKSLLPAQNSSNIDKFLKLQNDSLRNKYTECLDNSELLVILNWTQTDLNFDRPYYWRILAQKIQNGIFYQDPIDMKLFNDVISTPNQKSNADIDARLWRQEQLNLQKLNNILSMIKRDDSKFSISSIGLNVHAKESNENVTKLLQTAISASNEKYKNINYEKLLAIAKGDKKSAKEPLEELLVNLADLGLTNTSLANNNQWLFFTPSNLHYLD